MKKFLSLFYGFGLVMSAHAQIAISTSSLSYYQDFNSLSDTTLHNAYSTLPTHWSAQEFGSAADQEYRAAYGEYAGGDLYSFGDTLTPSDRALGSIGSGSNSTIYYGSSFVNQTNQTISSIAVTYMGEQWRQGRPGTARSTGPDTIFFEYAVNPSSISSGNYISYPTLDFASVENNGTLNTPLNGNLPANRALIQDTIFGLSLAPNDTIFIRWRDFNSSSYDDGLAVDSLTVTFIQQSALPRADYLYVGQSGQKHYEDFSTLSNTYPTATHSTLPDGWHAFETGSNSDQTYVVAYGELGGGNLYSFGDSASTDRSLGSLGSGSNTHIFYGAAFINNTGDSLRSVHVRYTGEQWRQGRQGNVRSTGPDTIFFGYAINSTINGSGFTEVSALHFPSAENNGTLNTPLDGNLPANQSKIDYTIEDLKVGPNDTVWVRWRDFNSSSYDDGLSVDSLLVTFYDTSSAWNPSPVPSLYREISQFNVNYTEDFNQLGNGYNPNTFDFNTLPQGWFANENGATTPNSYRSAIGEFGGGDIYSFGDSTSTERALGSIGSGSMPLNHFGSAWINTTGDTITTVRVKYTGEQWRTGRPYSARSTGPDTLHFAYGVNANGVADANFTSLTTLNFHTPQANGVLNTPLNGNDPANQTSLEYVLLNLSVAPNDTLWLRWTDYDSQSFDDGLAVDDFEITALDNFAATSITFAQEKHTITEVDGIVNIPVEIHNGNSFTSQVEVYVADQGTTTNLDFTPLGSNTLFQPGDTIQYASLILNRNEPFEGIEFFVLGIRNFGNAVAGQVLYDTVYIQNYDFPLYAISKLKSSKTSGVADSLNARVKVQGIVHGVNYSTSGGVDFYVLENTEGINVYGSNGAVKYTPQEGDEVMIWGQIAQFRGLTRIENLDSVSVVSTANALETPTVLSTLNESTESDLVTVENIQLYPAITNFPSDNPVTAITATNDTISLFISSRTDIAGKPAPTVPFTITGLGSQFADYNAPFEGGYRLMVIGEQYSSLEIEPHSIAGLAIYPNPFNEVVTISANSVIQTVIVYDLSGSILRRVSPNAQSLKLNLENLSKGTYILRLESATGISTQKIVK